MQLWEQKTFEVYPQPWKFDEVDYRVVSANGVLVCQADSYSVALLIVQCVNRFKRVLMTEEEAKEFRENYFG